MLTRIKNLFGCDVRSLAVFRIAIAVLLICEICDRFPYAEAFYSDAGFFSTEFSKEELPRSWSLNQLDGSVLYQQTILISLCVSAILFGLGLFTRVATIVCWFLLISIHVRNPMVLIGGDTLMRMVLFWSMFIPLGRVWSLDAIWKTRRQAARRQKALIENASSVQTEVGANETNYLVSFGTGCLILQLCFMYWFAGIAKLTEHWFDGTAMEYVLRLEIYVHPFGSWLLNFPLLLKAVTYGTLVLELFGPFLLFIPVWNHWFRLLVIAAFWSLHIGIDLSIDVGMFSVNSMAVWLVLLPSFVWDCCRKKNVQTTQVSKSPIVSQSPRSVWLTAWKYLLNGIAAFFLLYIFLWNAIDTPYAIKQGYRDKMSPDFYRLGWATMVAQNFKMFGTPPKSNPWFVYYARLQNGEEVDLLRNGPVDYSRPDIHTKVYKSNRWKKLHRFLLRHSEHNKFHQAILEYFIRKWDQSHPDSQHVVEAKLESFSEEIGPNYNRGDYIQGASLAFWETEDEIDKSRVELLDDVDSFFKRFDEGSIID
jgi:hypothetical protein